MRYITTRCPTLSESSSQQLVAVARACSSPSGYGAGTARASKKFAVPGGNEAVTNEISRGGERRGAPAGKAEPLNGI